MISSIFPPSFPFNSNSATSTPTPITAQTTSVAATPTLADLIPPTADPLLNSLDPNAIAADPTLALFSTDSASLFSGLGGGFLGTQDPLNTSASTLLNDSIAADIFKNTYHPSEQSNSGSETSASGKQAAAAQVLEQQAQIVAQSDSSLLSQINPNTTYDANAQLSNILDPNLFPSVNKFG